jgi:hypothetical protein
MLHARYLTIRGTLRHHVLMAFYRLCLRQQLAGMHLGILEDY